MLRHFITLVLLMLIGTAPAFATYEVKYNAGFPSKVVDSTGNSYSIQEFKNRQNYRPVNRTYVTTRPYYGPNNYRRTYVRVPYGLRYNQPPVIVTNNIVVDPAKTNKTVTPIKKEPYTRNGITYYN